MKFFSQSFLYECVLFHSTCGVCLMRSSDPWPIVSLAFFLRYPNPYASHILSCDVISRKFTPSGTLLTTRLILKTATLPRWAKSIVSRSESWIIEESEVDPHGKVVRCLTRNLEHVKAMQIHETQIFSQPGEGFVDTLPLFHTRLKPNLQGKLCRPRKLELCQGLDGASLSGLKTMASHVSGRTSSGCVIPKN
jgi:hypothetical protein